MRKKTYILVTVVLFFILVGVMLKSPPPLNDFLIEDEPEIIDEDHAEEDFIVDPIEYINLKSENRLLKEELESLERSYFASWIELVKIIVDAGQASQLVSYYYGDTAELIYAEADETRYILYFQDDQDKSPYHYLVVGFENGIGEFFAFLDSPGDDFTWYGGGEVYSGSIQNPDIQSVQVVQNEQVSQAEIISVDNDLRVWYSLIDFERKPLTAEPDDIRIEALNSQGEIIWQEAFKGNLGG
ncbi:hypothetical protein [Amphibacillus sediminis]|uniref:hypothetical protein n=1 Tax=Amphibacillus sediminis TaxID=360185 RepID=UPI000834518F|nr:hypothetical protein [Amphibacillus sediminis]